MIGQFFTSLGKNCGGQCLPASELYEEHQEELRRQAEIEEYRRFMQQEIAEKERELLRRQREHTKMQLRHFLQEEEKSERLSTVGCVDYKARDDDPVQLYTNKYHLDDDIDSKEENLSEDEEEDPVAPPDLSPAAVAQKKHSLYKNQLTTTAMTKQSLARIILCQQEQEQRKISTGTPEAASNAEQYYARLKS